MFKKLTFVFPAFFLAGLFCFPQIHAQQTGSIELFSRQTGKSCIFKIEIAETEDQRSRGLMFREKMDPSAGMFFIYPDQAVRTFWMKNTLIPLDIIFISSERRVVHIRSHATPMSEATISSQFPAQYVLEINAGLAKKFKLAKGDQARWMLNTSE